MHQTPTLKIEGSTPSGQTLPRCFSAGFFILFFRKHSFLRLNYKKLLKKSVHDIWLTIHDIFSPFSPSCGKVYSERGKPKNQQTGEINMILIGRFFIGIFKWMVRRIIRFTIILAILAALILVGVPHLMKHCISDKTRLCVLLLPQRTRYRQS